MVKESEETMSTVQPFLIEVWASSAPFSIQNLHISAEFNENGLLNSITPLHGQRDRIALGVEFVAYDSRKGPSRSGAYLFLPDGDAQAIQPDENHHVLIINGSIRSLVEVHLPFVVHQVVLSSSPGKFKKKKKLYSYLKL